VVAFAVDPSSYNPESWIHILRGSKDTSIVSMTLNGVSGLVTHPTATMWQVYVILSPGTNSFTLVGTDNVGNTTETVTVDVVLPAYVPQVHASFNDVDKHSLMAGIRRLPGEKNIFLIRRTKDAGTYPTGTHKTGAADAISRALGLTCIRNALAVYVNRDSTGSLLSQTATIEITPSHVLVDADEISTTEACQVDPQWPGFYLTHGPRNESDVEILTDTNTKIDRSQYAIDPYTRLVRFTSQDYDRSWVWVRYKYRTSFSRSGNVGSVRDFLNSISVYGQQLFTASAIDANKNESGLYQTAPNTVSSSTNPTYIHWGPVQIYDLHDKRFRDSLLNTYGAAYGTLLQAWAKTISKKSKFGWDGVILDVDMWDPLYKRRDNAVLPHLMDSHRGHWRCADPTDTTRYTYSQYRAYSGMCPNHPNRSLEYVGVQDNQWHSGVGGESDLMITGLEAKQ